MKKFITVFIFFAGIHSVISQTVLSSCSGSDSIKKLYIRDASRLALRKIYAQNLSDTSSIIIPKTHIDTILRALIAVYNATMLPARNAVVSQYNIHTFPNPSLNDFYVSADSTLPWMQQLKAGNLTTGNAQIDSLISMYYLTKKSYSTYYGLTSFHNITFTSDSNYNLLPLANFFDSITGVFDSEPISYVGSGNDISASIYPNHVELIYSLGWGDCPSFCIYWHYWKFKVYHDCSVEYMGEYGTPLPPSPITISFTGTTCVNETLTVTISGATSYSLNGSPISVAQFTLSAPTPTYYLVTASNSTTLITNSVSVIECVTALKENVWYLGSSIFPNPVGSILNIEFPQAHKSGNEKTEIRIIDVFGKVILNKELKKKNGATQINVSTLSSGIYYIMIGNEIKKIVKE